MKKYQIFRCPHCNCEYYDKSAVNGRSVGDPMVECPDCGKKSFRKNIIEPAVIGQNRYFNLKFSTVYGNLRIGIILIYAVFLFFVLVKKDMYLSLMLLCAAVIIFAIYGLVHSVHMLIFFRTDEYDNEILRSLARLEDASYAKMISINSGVDKNSIYYYKMNKKQ